MFCKDLTPPSSGRLSSSSGSPDSVYKSSTDSSRTTLNFSPDSISNRTSTAYKPPTLPLPKFSFDDDSDNECEWNPSMASPIQQRPPSLRKMSRCRSRLNGDAAFASPYCK